MLYASIVLRNFNYAQFAKELSVSRSKSIFDVLMLYIYINNSLFKEWRTIRNYMKPEVWNLTNLTSSLSPINVPFKLVRVNKLHADGYWKRKQLAKK